MRASGVILLGLAVMFTGAARAGVYMEWSNLDVASGKLTPRNRLYAQQGLLRMESADGKTTALFRDNSFVMLDPAGKSYRVLDKATMDQMAGKMNDMMSAMQARLASLPPEQRAAMQRAMGGSMPGGAAAPRAPTIEVKDDGGSGSAGGRSCHLWDLLRDGKPAEQLCVVPTGTLPGMSEVEESLKAAAAFGSQMQESLQARGGAGMGSQGLLPGNVSQMQKIGGMPVASRRYDSSGALAATEWVMTQWQQRSIDASQFEIPAGYTRKDFMGGHQPQ